VDKSDLEFICQKFNIRPQPGPLMPQLSKRGVGTADVALALMWDDRIAAVEEIIGKKITHLPPDPRLNPRPYARIVPARKIRSVEGAPQTYHKISLFRVGLTEQQLVVRGLTRRDIKYAERQGYVKFTEGRSGWTQR
jgi:hypothetical protein